MIFPTLFFVVVTAFLMFILTFALFNPNISWFGHDQHANAGDLFQFVLLSVFMVLILAMCMRTISSARRLSWQEAFFVIFTPIVVTYNEIFMFALLYRDLDVVAPIGKLSDGDYLYFSIVTWTTLGYGDLSPIGLGRFLASTEALFGYVISGLTIALYTAMLLRRPQ